MKVYTVIESYSHPEDGHRIVAAFTSRREAWKYVLRCVEGFAYSFINEGRRIAGAGKDEHSDDLRYEIGTLAIHDGAKHADLPRQNVMLREYVAHTTDLRIESAGLIVGGEYTQTYPDEGLGSPSAPGGSLDEELGLSEDVFASGDQPSA